MEILELKQSIKKGLTNGYKQNIHLLSSYNTFIDEVREYLLTVNVAQELLDWNKDYRYSIQIEYPILYFYNNAFLSHYWNMTDIFNIIQVSRQLEHSPTDTLNQKIDIAITQEQLGSLRSTQDRTLCGIELKGINKNTIEIINDLKRMSSAMILTDPISENSIEFCFCGFIKRFDKNENIVTSTFIQNVTTDEQNKWAETCNNLAKIYPKLSFTVEHFPIESATLEMVSNRYNEDSDYSEVANDTGIVIGYLLTIMRK